MKKYIFHLLFLSIFSNISLFSQSLSFKGTFYFDATLDNYDNNLKSVYIPEILLFNNVDKNSFIDFKWSYFIQKSLTIPSNNNRYKYRLWARYANTNFDFRVGLQKIAFGPAYILRPLSWFDTIDFTDLTGQTIGVKSMRLIYTPSNNLSVWTWLIDSDSKIPSYGARVELSNSAGDWGITYHKSEISEDYRLGFDYRHDGVFGFWTENSFQYKIDGSSKKNSSTIGFDYTIPILNGIYLMTETMHSTLYLPNTHYTVTAFNVDFPIDFLNKFSLVSAISWDNRDTYHLLRFITTYDDFSIDFNTQITDGKWDKNFRISFVYNY